jgi:hypothetical protein
LTVVIALADPPPPEQLIPYDVLLLGLTLMEPDVGRLPLQPPVPEQAVTLLADQLSFEDVPDVIDAGFAEIEAVGASAVTETVTDLTVVPVGPVQDRL